MTEELTTEEIAELQKFVGGVNAPTPDEKHSVFKFLQEVAESDDTTKTGYLLDEEVGIPKNPVRTYKSVALICKDIIGNPELEKHFVNEAEIITSTSLSRQAKLLELAVIQRRQLEDVTGRKKTKKNKSWFKKKGDTSSEE